MLKLIQIDSNKLLLGNGDGTVTGAGAASQPRRKLITGKCKCLFSKKSFFVADNSRLSAQFKSNH